MASERRGRALLLSGLLVLLFAAGACESDSPVAPVEPPAPPAPPPTGPPPDTLDLPADPGHLFLEVWRLGGFVPIEYSLGRPPAYAVNVGGDFFYEGPMIEIFPGPLLPNIQAGRISTADVIEVSAAVAATGISQIPDEELIRQPATGPILADAPLTEVVLRDRDGTHILRVDALSAAAHTDPRVLAIRDLLDVLDSMAVRPGFSEHRGDRVQVWASAEPLLPDPTILKEQPWPLPDAPPAADGQGFECFTYEGATAAGLLEIFLPADHGTRWDYQGVLHQLFARSLIPREEACAR